MSAGAPSVDATAVTGTTAFDVRAYTTDPREIRPTDVDLGSLTGLTPTTLDVVADLWRVERSLLDLLRDVLVTPAHVDPRVTAFLITWTYEQFWLAETLAAVLEANGRPAVEPPGGPLGRLRRAWDDRARPTVTAVRTNLLGADVTAAHLVTAWLDAAALDLTYRALAAEEPRLEPLLTRAGALKARHLAFCADDAAPRLATSSGPRRLARRAATRWRWPGTRYAPVTAATARLLTGPVGAGTGEAGPSEVGLARLDATVAALPGLAGTAPVRGAVDRLGRQRRPAATAASPRHA
ncbi:hypothetical protein [Georgenia muralis]